MTPKWIKKKRSTKRLDSEEFYSFLTKHIIVVSSLLRENKFSAGLPCSSSPTVRVVSACTMSLQQDSARLQPRPLLLQTRCYILKLSIRRLMSKALKSLQLHFMQPYWWYKTCRLLLFSFTLPYCVAQLSLARTESLKFTQQQCATLSVDRTCKAPLASRSAESNWCKRARLASAVD